MKSLASLEPGDFILIEYSSSFVEFYVVRNYPEQEIITLGRQQWCNSTTVSRKYKDIPEIVYLGKGKKNWFSFIDIISTYSRPKET